MLDGVMEDVMDRVCDGVCDRVWLFGKDCFKECPLTKSSCRRQVKGEVNTCNKQGKGMYEKVKVITCSSRNEK